MANVILGAALPPPLTPATLALRWGCSSTLIYDLLASRELRGFRLGKLWRIPLSAIEDYETGSPHALDEAGPDDATPSPLASREVAATAARLVRLDG